jgi:hypothetical protein
MRRRALLFAGSIVAAACGVAACGERVDLGAELATVDPGGGAGGGSGSTGPVGSGGYAPLSGSYDLVFSHVGAKGHPSSAPSPSEGRRARIDLRTLGTDYEAIVTLRWGSPTSMTASVTDSEVLLTGSISVLDAANPARTDEWTLVRIPRKPDGSPFGSISAQGQASEVEGDVSTRYPIQSGGTIGRDRTAPALRAAPRSPLGPGEQLLPWDAVAIEAAEGVDAAALVRATALYRLDGAARWVAGPAAFTPGPVDPSVAWGGAVRVSGRTTSWDDWVGAVAHLVVAPDVEDPAGNAAGPLDALFPFAALPSPAAWHGFDYGLSQVANWGDVTWFGSKSGSMGLCEEGGCVELGPFAPVGCAPERIGISGRLQLLSPVSSVSSSLRRVLP